jgi:hypothetical protein
MPVSTANTTANDARSRPAATVSDGSAADCHHRGSLGGGVRTPGGAATATAGDVRRRPNG